MLALQVLVLVLAPLASSQPAPTNCCETKTVGGVSYTFVREDSAAIGYSCLSPCVYERDDQPGTAFCFAQGDQQVVCGDSPGLEGDVTEESPAWTDWGPWGSCSVTCGGGTRTRERECSQGLLSSALALADVVNQRAPAMMAIMADKMPAMMTIVGEKMPAMMAKMQARITAMVEQMMGMVMGGMSVSSRALNLLFGNNRNFFGQEDRLLQLMGAIQGRIPAALGALEDWKNNTKESVSQKIPFLLYSLSQNVTRIEEAFEQKLPGLMRILEGKAPRILNIIQARLPQILDIVEQRLPQLLTEAEGALPDLIDNMDEVMSGVLDIIEARVPALLSIIQEGLPPIMASLESSLPGILDVVEARMDGLLDTFEATLPQVLDVVGKNIVDRLDLIGGNIDEVMGIVASNLPRLLDSFERALPSLLDSVTAFLPGLLATVAEELPGVFDSFQENLSMLETSFKAGFMNFANETISTGFTTIEQMLPSAVQYVTTMVSTLQDSISDLLDIVEGYLPQIPAIVESQMTEKLSYYQQYFDSAKQALPWLFSSLAGLLDSISSGSFGQEGYGGGNYPGQYPGAGQGSWNFSAPNPGQGSWNFSAPNPGQGPMPGQGLWNFSNPNPGQGAMPGQGMWNFSAPNGGSFMEIPGQVLGEISQAGENMINLFRSVLKRQSLRINSRQGETLPSMNQGPSCPGEGQETENCGMSICPS